MSKLIEDMTEDELLDEAHRLGFSVTPFVDKTALYGWPSKSDIDFDSLRNAILEYVSENPTVGKLY